jgi:outer membrane protein TolC
MLSRRLTAVKSYKRRYFIMKAPSMSIVGGIHRTRAPVKIADEILRLLCAVILIAGFVLAPPWPRGSAEPRDFRTTPNPFRLLANQWSDFPPPSRPYSLEFLRSTDPATARISLKEAILIGLKNNPGIEVERLEPLRAAEQTMSEKSIFDPTLTFEFNKSHTVTPAGISTSTFFQPLQTLDNRDYDFSLKKLLRTGAELDLSFLNNRFVNSVPNQVLKPSYRPRLEFSLTQPLLRDFGWGLTTIFVRMAENREGISLLGYQTQLAGLIQRITEAYWGLFFAHENLAVQNKGREWAESLLHAAEAKVQAGALAPVAVTEALAELARREEQVIIAKNDVEIARTRLRLLINLNPEKTFLPRAIEPDEKPSVEPVPLDRADSIAKAFTRRPEILSAGLTVENQSLQARHAENQLLPRLDLKAGAGLTGLAGHLKPGTNNPFPGDYWNALDRMGSGEFYNYSVGVVLQIPLGNAQAKSKYAQARIELEQARARRRELVSQITLEVERALNDVATNFKRIQTTRRARELAEENLRGQEKRFGVGLVTQKDVIDFEAKLLDAQGAELHAITDYNNSIAALRLAEGTLLEHYNIKVEGPEKEPNPWWATF